MDNSKSDEISKKVFQGKAVKEKHKLIIKTALLSSIISITAFCMVSYHVYSNNRYKESLNHHAALYAFAKGELQLIEENDDINRKVYSGNGMRISVNELDEIHLVSDQNGGFIKTFKDNILQDVSIDDDLAQFVSYLNPKVWFGGERKVKTNKKYQVRSDREIHKLKQLIEEGGEGYLLSSNLEFLEIDNQYLIIK